MRVLCNWFGHKRDPRRMRPSRDGWRAPCRLCGARLLRIAHKQWRPLSTLDLEPQGAFNFGYRPAPPPRPQCAHAARTESKRLDGGPEILREQPVCDSQRRRTDGVDPDYESHRSVPVRPVEPEMFSIVLACCREIVRLAEHRTSQPNSRPASSVTTSRLFRDVAGRGNDKSDWPTP